MRPHYLTSLFSPRNVAVVGASDTPGSIGQAVFANLLAGTIVLTGLSAILVGAFWWGVLPQLRSQLPPEGGLPRAGQSDEPDNHRQIP